MIILVLFKTKNKLGKILIIINYIINITILKIKII